VHHRSGEMRSPNVEPGRYMVSIVSRAPASRGPAIRWLIFACLFGFAFFAYIQRTSVAVAADRMMPELGLSQIQIGWLLTAFMASYTIFQMPAGALGQRWGARKTLLLSSILALIGTFATAALPSLLGGTALFVTLLAARAVLGLAQAAIFPVTSGAIESWFPRAGWSFPQGLLASALNFGAAVTPPLIAWLMEAVNWRFALIASSVPLAALTVYWGRRARDRPSEDPTVSPAELAELADNPPPTGGARLFGRTVALLKDRDLNLITLSYLLMNYSFYLLTYWCFLYLVQERHLSDMESGWLAALPYIAAGIGAAAGGRFTDLLCRRLGERRGFRLVPLIALPIAALALDLVVEAPGAFWAVTALCLAFAAVEITEAAYWAAAMRVGQSESMVATGILNTGGNIGGVIGTPIVAALSAQDSWHAAFLTGSVCSIAAAALWLLINPARRALETEEEAT
jgi:ACS family glucarate transporter-like MFS transporter